MSNKNKYKNLATLAVLFPVLFFLVSIFQACNYVKGGNENNIIPEHINSKDISYIEDVFLHGYVHNIVLEEVQGRQLSTLTTSCTKWEHRQGKDLQLQNKNYSIWTRDLYWGFLGWAQAGDDRVLDMMKSSIKILIEAKNRNQALGQSELWPLNDKRYYIPQAFTTGLKSALNLYPWCSESQADFLLLCHDYWNLSGDINFIKSIWNDIEYIVENIELLDTNGNLLPDAMQGSYDYMWIKEGSEEPLMCAKTSLAYHLVATLAKELDEKLYLQRLEKLAQEVKKAMNKLVEDGGLWMQNDQGGYYVQMRRINKGNEGIEPIFIPYNNLVPVWCGMTNKMQEQMIFDKLDSDFKNYYDLVHGPMYCAPAGAQNEKSVMNCSSVPWLAFLDVYLRGKAGHENNRSEIFNLLIEHMGDVAGVPFSEGVGVYGDFTGGAGRSWDNGNFFHMLISGVYGIHKDKSGVIISDPNPLNDVPLTNLQNIRWRKATYNLYWTGKGNNIIGVTLDGKDINRKNNTYLLNSNKDIHLVKIMLSD